MNEPVAPLATSDPVASFWQAHRDGRDIALATSGTSVGQPRTIVRTTTSWVASFDACADRLGLTAASRFWIPGPLAATMNLFAACLAEHAGASWSTSRDGCTHAQLTPTQLAILLDAEPPRGLRALVAGDGLQPGLRQRAAGRGVSTSHYYGAAELSLVAWGTAADDLRLFDRVEAELRDGVLWVRSPWLSRTATDERGFATVGDLAGLDGDHLLVHGRPGAVTTAGDTVLLAPLEDLLGAHCDGPLLLVGVPHQRLGEVVCAIAPRAALDGVRAWAHAHLDGAMRPRRWVAAESLPEVHPMTSAGKLDRRALARQVEALP